MADDIIAVSTTGTSVQNIDNTSVKRPDGTLVDRQRIVLKGDLDFQQPPLMELYLIELLELQRQTLLELKVQTYIFREMFSGGDIAMDDIEAMRRDPSVNDPQQR